MPSPNARVQRLSRELLVVAFSSGRRFPPWAIDRMSRYLDERAVAEGDIVYHEGDVPAEFYFMGSGKIEFTRAGKPTIVREGRSIFGTHEAIADRPRMRTARALAPTQLVTVRADAWLDLLEDTPALARAVLAGTALGTTMLHARAGAGGGFAEPAPACGAPPRSPLTLVDRLLVLRDVPLLGGAGAQALTDLAGAAEERVHAPGDPLPLREGLHVVVDGLVAVTQGDVEARFGAGQLVGGAIALGDTAGAWKAHAVAPTLALAVPAQVWGDELDDHFDLFRSAMTAVSDEREDLLERLAAASGTLLLR